MENGLEESKFSGRTKEIEGYLKEISNYEKNSLQKEIDTFTDDDNIKKACELLFKKLYVDREDWMGQFDNDTTTVYPIPILKKTIKKVANRFGVEEDKLFEFNQILNKSFDFDKAA